MPQVPQSPAASSSGSQPTNAQIRAYILQKGIPVLQSVQSGTATFTNGQPTNVATQANPTGIIRRFFLEISGTINCAATHTATPTPIGLGNLLSNITFTDQSNRLRVNTTSAHLHLNASQKRKRPFGAAITTAGMSDPTGLGANFPVQKTTGAVAGGTAQNFTMIFEIPVVNANHDLTGMIYANQVTSNNRLQFTFNPAMFEFSGDGFNSAYSMDAALATSLPTLTNITWNLYQDIIDQFQQPNGAVILPPNDVSIALCLMMISPGPQVAGQDNQYSLPPFFIYQNLMLFWDNYTYNGAGGVGSDLTYIRVQISNSYILRQWDALLLAVQTRNVMGSDMPGFVSAGTSGAVYNLDFRAKPLLVNQNSATNIIFHPNTVEAGSALMMGQEYLWKSGQLSN